MRVTIRGGAVHRTPQRFGRDPYTQLAFHVLQQAFMDAAANMPVDVESLRPWAFVARLPQRALERRLACARTGKLESRVS